MDGSDFLDTFFSTLIFINLPLALVAGYIAHKKGSSFWLFFFFGLAIAIVAIPVALFMKKDEKAIELRRLKTNSEEKCPHCLQYIPRQASVCSHCRKEITDEDRDRRLKPPFECSFNPPVGFPEHTQFFVYEGRSIALLPDQSVVVDNGKWGHFFSSRDEYEALTGKDYSLWQRP